MSASDQASKPDATQDAKVATTDAGDALPAPEPVKPDVANSEPPKPDAARPEAAKPESAATGAAKPEQAKAPASPETAVPATKVATLGGSAVKIEEPSPTKAEARKAERDAEKEKARAEKKAKARRHLAAQRARAARQLAAQRAADPFGQTSSLLTPARTP